jgi:HD superfamily phosphodiesterase
MQGKIKRKVKRMLDGRDPAHDFYHIMRVYKNAKLIGQREDTNTNIER